MVSVTLAVPADAGTIVSLLDEMDEFYGDPKIESFDDRLAQVNDSVFENGSSCCVVLARAGDDVVGLASCSMLWPAVRTTRSLYLKELYVLKAWRGKGVGRALMNEVQRMANEGGCSRIEFTTDVQNADAQAFYEALGFDAHRGKLFYRRKL
jgi:ribosomal protein S18 acetylase RimI-like enzyme